MEHPSLLRCPLCDSLDTGFFRRDRTRDYHLCPVCDLVFVPPEQLPNPEEEKARYETHNNSPDDEGYRAFLSRFAVPFCRHLGEFPQEGLDFGCGPGPALHLLLETAGHRMTLYDPFFAPDLDALERTYDFITCTESIEHFHDPGREWRRWMHLLRPGGHLGIMTRFRPGPEEFMQWRYREDFTHIRFFSRRTFEYLAVNWNMSCTFVDWDICILQKN